MSSHNLKHLQKAIFPLSQEQADWDKTVLEWELVDIHQEDDGTCPCTHYPIVDRCLIHNRVTGNDIEVGNICVQRFGGTIAKDTKQSYAGLKRIKKDPWRSRASPELIRLALGQGIITQKDVDFYLDTIAKRSLIGRRQQWRVDINRRIVAGMSHPLKCPQCHGRGRPLAAQKNQKIFFVCPRCPGQGHYKEMFIGWYTPPPPEEEGKKRRRKEKAGDGAEEEEDGVTSGQEEGEGSEEPAPPPLLPPPAPLQQP